MCFPRCVKRVSHVTLNTLLQADLIMSGTKYKDAVKGTEFDDLDEETAQEFEESVRRLTALRENRLEEYLESNG